MKIIKPFLVFFFLVLLWITWQVYLYFNPNFNECFEENTENFQEHISEFNEIVKQIKPQSLPKNKEIFIECLPQQTQEKLSNLGIKTFLINETENCKEKFNIEFHVFEGWNIKALNHVSIIYSPCDENTLLNSHYNSNFIDTWGQGSNWKIFSDSDFI